MILGIDISTNDVAVILAQPDGGAELALRSPLPREGGSPAIWLAAMETARETLRRGRREPAQVECTGLVFHAPVDERGLVMPSPRAVGWEGFDLQWALREHLGVADAVAENRVLGEALGEWRFGALRSANADESGQPSCPDWLYVHLGSTIGGAALVNGGLLRGRARAAVEVGAICIERNGALGSSGRRGALEGYCGGEAFIARARSYGLNFKMASEVWDAAPSNSMAQSLCEEYSNRLAQGLGGAVVMLNPQRLVIGGALGNVLGERLLAPLRQTIQEFCRPAHFNQLQIGNGQLGDDAAVLGAVALALQKREL
ncbi:MAG TPA: ROK family protein [Abditibacteriaceae bacterium]|nr:ROK family protein [Abditibacteriaceae bacterium]